MLHDLKIDNLLIQAQGDRSDTIVVIIIDDKESFSILHKISWRITLLILTFIEIVEEMRLRHHFIYRHEIRVQFIALRIK